MKPVVPISPRLPPGATSPSHPTEEEFLVFKMLPRTFVE